RGVGSLRPLVHTQNNSNRILSVVPPAPHCSASPPLSVAKKSKIVASPTAFGWRQAVRSSVKVLSGLIGLKIILLQQPIQRPAADGQRLSGGHLVPFLLLQAGENVPPLDFPQEAWVRSIRAELRNVTRNGIGQIIQSNQVLLGQDLGALQHIRQLPHVSRP